MHRVGDGVGAGSGVQGCRGRPRLALHGVGGGAHGVGPTGCPPGPHETQQVLPQCLGIGD